MCVKAAAGTIRAAHPSHGVYGKERRRCMVLDIARASIRRTNINLDRELVAAAAAVLGTVQATETVHTALRDVVDRAARSRLASRDLSDLTPAALAALRRP